MLFNLEFSSVKWSISDWNWVLFCFAVFSSDCNFDKFWESFLFSSEMFVIFCSEILSKFDWFFSWFSYSKSFFVSSSFSFDELLLLLLFVFNNEISSFNFWISICNDCLSKSLISILLFKSVICSIKKLFFSYKSFNSFSLLLLLFSCNFLFSFNSLFNKIFSLFKFSICFSNSLFLFFIFSISFSYLFWFSINLLLLSFKFLFLFSFSLLFSFKILFSFFNSFKFSFNLLISNL